MAHQAEINRQQQRYFEEAGGGDQAGNIDLGDDGDQGDRYQRNNLETAKPVFANRLS